MTQNPQDQESLRQGAITRLDDLLAKVVEANDKEKYFFFIMAESLNKLREGTAIGDLTLSIPYFARTHFTGRFAQFNEALQEMFPVYGTNEDGSPFKHEDQGFDSEKFHEHMKDLYETMARAMEMGIRLNASLERAGAISHQKLMDDCIGLAKEAISDLEEYATDTMQSLAAVYRKTIQDLTAGILDPRDLKDRQNKYEDNNNDHLEN